MLGSLSDGTSLKSKGIPTLEDTRARGQKIPRASPLAAVRAKTDFEVLGINRFCTRH